MSNHEHDHSEHHHHILPDNMAAGILMVLFLMTGITVYTALKVDLGAFNFTLAMLIASFKAILVCMFFMGLKYDTKENSMIFSTSIIFMIIFMVLTFTDLLTRGDVYVKGPLVPETAQKSKYQKPWIASPELVAQGKELFTQQCVTCHGANGDGAGPAAAGLNPKPRNFIAADGWKNGRKPTQIFGTLTKGLNTMPSFGSLPSDDRWALVHYVRTFGPHESEKDAAADFTKAGIDPTKDDGGMGGEKSIPVGAAIDAISEK